MFFSHLKQVTTCKNYTLWCIKIEKSESTAKDKINILLPVNQVYEEILRISYFCNTHNSFFHKLISTVVCVTYHLTQYSFFLSIKELESENYGILKSSCLEILSLKFFIFIKILFLLIKNIIELFCCCFFFL